MFVPNRDLRDSMLVNWPTHAVVDVLRTFLKLHPGITHVSCLYCAVHVTADLLSDPDIRLARRLLPSKSHLYPLSSHTFSHLLLPSSDLRPHLVLTSTQIHLLPLAHRAALPFANRTIYLLTLQLRTRARSNGGAQVPAPLVPISLARILEVHVGERVGATTAGLTPRGAGRRTTSGTKG